MIDPIAALFDAEREALSYADKEQICKNTREFIGQTAGLIQYAIEKGPFGVVAPGENEGEKGFVNLYKGLKKNILEAYRSGGITSRGLRKIKDYFGSLKGVIRQHLSYLEYALPRRKQAIEQTKEKAIEKADQELKLTNQMEKNAKKLWYIA